MSIILLLILFISVVGWLILPIVSECLIDNPLYDYFVNRGIYLTKSDAINARFKDFYNKYPDLTFTTEDIQVILLDAISDSQWKDIVDKGKHLRMDKDLSIDEEQIKGFKKNLLKYSLNDKEIDFMYGNKIYISDTTHNRSIKNGLYVKVTRINNEFFKTKYGKKIADKYVLSVPPFTGNPDSRAKNSMARLASTSKVNYGEKTVEVILNWT